MARLAEISGRAGIMGVVLQERLMLVVLLYFAVIVLSIMY